MGKQDNNERVWRAREGGGGHKADWPHQCPVGHISIRASAMSEAVTNLCVMYGRACHHVHALQWSVSRDTPPTALGGHMRHT
jgi:hypothetical protein